MCQDPGYRLKRYAVCSCGAEFPLCDKQDALEHINLKPGVANHAWVFVRQPWWSELNVQEAKA